MNPAFHFVSNRVFSAPRTSPARAFFARQSMFEDCARLRDNSRARLHLLCTYRMHVCPHVRYVRIIPAQRRAEFPRSSIRTLPQLHTCPPKWRVKLAGCVAPSTKCRTGNILFPRHCATHLNPVFRSIAPQNNNPKNVPVHGLNVIASARIQTSSNGGFATRGPFRKGKKSYVKAEEGGGAWAMSVRLGYTSFWRQAEAANA